MEKQKYNAKVIASAIAAVYEVLNRPKNIVKPVFTEDIGELCLRAKGEMIELNEEVFASEIDYAKTRAEAADTIAYLAALIYACDRRLADATC